MNDIISTIMDALKEVGTGLIEFIKEGVSSALFDTVGTGDTATQVLSDFAKFGFVMAGLSLGLGLLYFVVNLVRRKI